jgi:hypothetical protein
MVHSHELLESSLRKSFNGALRIFHLYEALVAEKTRERAK